MSKNFIEPSYTTNKGSSKSYVYSSYPGDRVVSPYDGVVVSVSDTECNGNIRIKHNFDGNTIYSNFCGIGRSKIAYGENVSQSKPIGIFGDKEIKFEVIDQNGVKQNISSLMSNKKSDTKNIENKDEPKKEKFVPYDGKSSGIGSDIMKLALTAPFAAIEKLADSAKIKKKPKPKPEEEPNDIVFEEIHRIKNLMK